MQELLRNKPKEMLRNKPNKGQEVSSYATTSLESGCHTEGLGSEEGPQMAKNQADEAERKDDEEKRRLAEKQKDEADCIALRLIAEQMASQSKLSNTSMVIGTNQSKMQSFLSLRTESTLSASKVELASTSQKMNPQLISPSGQLELGKESNAAQEEVGSPKDETDSSCNGEEVYYQATTTASSHVKEEPPPLPPKARVSALSPSPSSRGQPSPSFSDDTITSQSTIKTGQYIRVREKVVQLERKLEEEALKLEEEEEGGTPRAGVRPENLVGAVRLLPTPTPPNSRPASQASSRKSSLTRSSSMEGSSRHGLLSPTTVGGFQSPAFARRHLDTPPPMYR